MTLQDTTPEARRVRSRLLRKLSGPEKLAALSDLTSLVRSLMLAGLRERLPHASELEVEAEHFRLVLGPELARQVLAHRDEVRRGVDGAP